MRERSGLRVIDVSRLLGVPRPKITQYETGAKHPLPWALDMLGYVYNLTPYENWMLFFEAGYTTIDMPPPIITMLKAWGNLPEHMQEPALHVLQGAAELLSNWTDTSEAVGYRAERRSTPTAEDVDRFWKERAGSRYHSRRVDTTVSTRDRVGPTEGQG